MADGGSGKWREWRPGRPRTAGGGTVILFPRRGPVYPPPPEPGQPAPWRRWRKRPPRLLGYGIYDPSSDLWLTRGDDGGLRFNGIDPAPLGAYFPDADDRFAFSLLDRLAEWAETGEVVGDQWADCTAAQAAGAMVAAIPAPRRHHMLAPLADAVTASPADRPLWTFLDFVGADQVMINHDLRQNGEVRFDVHGPAPLVDRLVADYLAAYPEAEYGTRVVRQDALDGQRAVRVMRRATAGMPAPWD